ncbi:phosphoribosylformylglycinamidine synthase [Anaerofustis sp.]|uniref:phosphoribosylformylglycinamidine synthase n=1 Tax=Anaerofustis sp. TaxID=1872517 RepID=UPI0025BBCA21|nr:phosphoribosylformylglycinamidine synthase [Anaerofustis sp.]
MIKRVFIGKKEGFDTAGENLLNDLKVNLNITGLTRVNIFNRYDLLVDSSEHFENLVNNVLSEVNVDDIYVDELPEFEGAKLFGIEYLPGQYDQRADSAQQCANLIMTNEDLKIKNARVYVLYGDISDAELNEIKNYLINPVDSREVILANDIDLTEEEVEVKRTPIIEGFIDSDDSYLEKLLNDMGLAMDINDLKLIRDYFKNDEKRNPTLTEIRVLDTYWSDHCRHTTFSTHLTDIDIEQGGINDEIKGVYDEYMALREKLYVGKNKPVTLMDMAVIGTKEIKARGLLNDLEESDEINACSIRANVDVDGKDEKYLIMFKNETHNHPTEIEPFGGAATCLGGAIRDPLSGRSYVYQSMRVTGSADPTVPYDKTLKGKLSQREITTGACHGFSSYGNQIGLQTGQVKEYYHPNYVAKRMEVGAVIAAAKEENVKRLTSDPGDIIVLVGGRTGRDGIGGASGSSKEHTEKSVLTAGSEVQKGNPIEERKLQRLFRTDEVAKMIKKCNDFGAGGVSVAVGELADSLNINLDSVLKKYEGLDATEIAISESQERMAVVIAKEDKEKFIEAARKENLEAVQVATVTDDGNIVMTKDGEEVLKIKRSFVDTNGASKSASIKVRKTSNVISSLADKNKTNEENFVNILKNHNVCSQKGLVEYFDNTIGANNVLMPYGGKYMLSEVDGMVAKVPLEKGDTKTATVMTNGFDPELLSENPYLGAMYAVISSVSKAVALGADYKKLRLSFQEYFERLRKDPERWAKPFIALLGALKVQLELNTPAIGGKDSMSGSFEDIDVPPTLISFAVGVVNADKVVSSEFKRAGNNVYVVKVNKTENNTPDFESARNVFDLVHDLIEEGKVKASKSITVGGACEAISKMCFGNKLGFEFAESDYDIYAKNYGDIIIETSEVIENENVVLLGKTIEEKEIRVKGEAIDLEMLIKEWENPLLSVFPIDSGIETDVKEITYTKGSVIKRKTSIASPKVIVPVFPGTNCEYDTAKAFNEAGADSDIFVFKNKTQKDIEDSVLELENRIRSSQIIALPGGFSAGDEPDGSAKFIVSVFKNERIKDAVMDLLKNRDGLMLGICNGFQALIKTGLVPYGEIRDLDENSPTLTFNLTNRHIANISYIRVASNLSPWFKNVNVGDTFVNPISHGEGRFVCEEKVLQQLIANGQVATQYTDESGNLSVSPRINQNGSVCAIEGITSPDGRILGKMGHSERKGSNLYKNIYGEMEQNIFLSGVEYFK